MIIISAKYVNGQSIPNSQIQRDKMVITKIHNKEMKKGTWGFFGGVITVKDRCYQVAP